MTDAPTGPSRPPSETDENKPIGQDQDPSASPRRPASDPSKSQVGKLWEAFGNPEESANSLVRENRHKPGKGDPSLWDGISTMPFNTTKTFYRMACAREALLYGIGSGFVAGGLRSVLGGLRTAPAAANWAVFTFAVVSLGKHEHCRMLRKKEKSDMNAVFQAMEELRQKRKRDLDKRIAEQAALEEEKKRKSWTNLSNYKFW